MSGSKTNKNTALSMDQKIVLGVGKYFTKVKTLTLAGTSYTPAALKALFQAEVDESNSLDQARAQLKEEVVSTRATRAKAMAARKALKAYILGNYGGQAVAMLEDFGMTPPKTPGAKTVAVKAESAAKAVATKKAGGKGKQSPEPPAPSAAAPAVAPVHVVQSPVNGAAPVAAPAASSTPQ